MGRAFVTLSMLAAIFVAVPRTQAPTAGIETPSFRAGVDLVSMNVTVTDRDGRFMTNLVQEDFSVFESGVLQEISFFAKSELPIALSMLLDSSASMQDKMGTLQTAAGEFVRRLQPSDLAQVLDFDSRVEIRQSFTSDVAALESAIRQTNAGGSTSLYNALYVSLKELRRVQVESTADLRRQALVVFSDGEDTSSLVSFDEVLDLAKRSETAIYTIVLRGDESLTRGFREAEFVMRQLAQETGGRAFFASEVADLSGIYEQIADELSSQYTIGYLPQNTRRDGAWRPLIVQVSASGLTPRTKRGYYAPTPN